MSLPTASSRDILQAQGLVHHLPTRTCFLQGCARSFYSSGHPNSPSTVIVSVCTDATSTLLEEFQLLTEDGYRTRTGGISVTSAPKAGFPTQSNVPRATGKTCLPVAQSIKWSIKRHNPKLLHALYTRRKQETVRMSATVSAGP